MFEEADYGRVVEEPGLVFVAAFAVCGFVEVVFCAEVGCSLGWGGAAGEDGEEGGPGVVGCVVAGR